MAALLLRVLEPFGQHHVLCGWFGHDLAVNGNVLYITRSMHGCMVSVRLCG